MDLNKVKRLPDGRYYWNCVVDKSYEEFGYKVVFIAIGGFCVLMLGMGLVLGDRNAFKATLLSAVIIMAITAGITLLVKWLYKDGMSMGYELSEDYITLRNGKPYPYALKRVRTVIVKQHELELRGPLLRVRVFIPQEDFTVMKDQIIRRIPNAPDIQYRQG